MTKRKFFAAIAVAVIAINIAQPSHAATIAGDSSSAIVQQADDGPVSSPPCPSGEGATAFPSLETTGET